MRKLMLIVAALAFISACVDSKNHLLIPKGIVNIYLEVSGGDPVGTIADPVKVISIKYPDKSDYVVEVEVLGRSYYVRDGNFELHDGSIE
ncbi:MAG: hypothetical protein QHC77_17825 [Stenotrophomonas sp.]|uniref:hypothetical protein n=1 Tax=Stenotrophomonas sp. TaxID=69392 RepID=UPI0029B2D0DB|nr:hypothetical protein [Stenotrophomonas sp.]MDX3933794.1 hypothetical protein [Stenotrophomonas sp.]